MREAPGRPVVDRRVEDRTVLRRLWWLQLPGLLVLFSVFTVVIAWYLPPNVYRVNWRSPKLVNGGTVFRVLLGSAAMLVGWFIAQGGARTRIVPRPDRVTAVDGWHRRAFRITFLLAMFGNAVLLARGFSNGFRLSQIGDLLSGTSDVSYTLKEETFKLVPGVTTTTQFAPLAAVLAATLPSKRWPTVRRQLWMLVGFTVLRSLLFSERLAMVEVMVPFFVAVGIRRVRSGWRPPKLLGLMPMIALPGLIIFFTAFEYTRSWSFYSKEGNQSLLTFGATRLEGYYATAHNNSEVVWRHRDAILPMPYDTLGFIWDSPGLNNLYETLNDKNPGKIYHFYLVSDANAEYNNPGGYGALYGDWGLPVGTTILVGYGMVCRRLNRGMWAGHETGTLLYPIVVVSLMELPRIWYITAGRIFPSVVGAIFIAQRGVQVKRKEALAEKRREALALPTRTPVYR